MLIFTIILLIIISVILGLSLSFVADKKFIRDICFFLMKYIKRDYNFIYAFLMAFIYFLNLLIFSVIISLFYNVNIFPYFLIKREYIAYIFVGVIGELSLIAVIASFLFIFPFMRKGKSIGEEISSIPWVKSVWSVPPSFRWILVVSSAFLEEVFFRGVLYIMLRVKFPNVSFIIFIIIVSFIFSVEQVLQTVNFKQGFVLWTSSIVISVVGCLLLEYTGSLIPALVSHISFVIYYFKQTESSKKPVNDSNVY